MRILLVEDEAKVSNFVSRGLAAERFAVDVASDGQSGFELATTYDYDLLILDLMLPVLDGRELLRRVRRKNSYVPVLILTARDNEVCGGRPRKGWPTSSASRSCGRSW